MKKMFLSFVIVLLLAVPAFAGRTAQSTLTMGCATAVAEESQEKEGDFSLVVATAKVAWASAKLSARGVYVVAKPMAKVAWASTKLSAKGVYAVAKPAAKSAYYPLKKIAHFLF